MKKLFIAFLLCCAAVCAFAQDAPDQADLKLIFTPGQTAEYKTETSFLGGDVSINGTSMPLPQQAIRLAGEIKQTCVAKDKAGNGTVCAYTVMAAEGIPPVKSYVKSVVDPRGKVVKLLEMETDGKKVDFAKEKNRLAGATLSQFLNQAGYPDKPVKVGEGWKINTVKSAKNPFACDLVYILESIYELNGDRIARVVCTGTVEVGLDEAVRLLGTSSTMMSGDVLSGMNGTARITVDKDVSDVNLTKGVLRSEDMKCSLAVNIADETSGLGISMNAALESVVQLAGLSSK